MMNGDIMNRVGAVTCITLFTLQLLLVLLSWMISSAQTDSTLHSLLSGEGVRWMVGSFATSLSNPIGAYLLLCIVAWGTASKAQIHHAMTDALRRRHLTYRQRFALRMSVITAVIMVALWLYLILAPQPVLLSAIGEWVPSSFSRGMIPVLAFIITAVSLVYGSFSGMFSSLADAYKALWHGPKVAAPIVPIYILVVMLLSSLEFVFC